MIDEIGDCYHLIQCLTQCIHEGNYVVSGGVKGVEAVEAKAKLFKARMTVGFFYLISDYLTSGGSILFIKFVHQFQFRSSLWADCEFSLGLMSGCKESMKEASQHPVSREANQESNLAEEQSYMPMPYLLQCCLIHSFNWSMVLIVICLNALGVGILYLFMWITGGEQWLLQVFSLLQQLQIALMGTLQGRFVVWFFYFKSGKLVDQLRLAYVMMEKLKLVQGKVKTK